MGAWTVIDREAMRGPTFKNGTCVLFVYYRSILLKYNWKNPEQNAVAGTCQMCRAIQPVCVELYLQIQLHFCISMSLVLTRIRIPPRSQLFYRIIRSRTPLEMVRGRQMPSLFALVKYAGQAPSRI